MDNTKLAYFDNAATSFPKPECVYQAMDACARSFGVNVGRGQYPLAEKASSIVEQTRKQLAEFFHAPAMQVVFTPSATIAMNEVLQGLDYSNIHCVYLSPFEHNAVYRTINYLRDRLGFEVRLLPVSKQPFAYDVDGTREVFKNHKPDLVIISHASNVCGAVAPVKDLFTLAHSFGATTILDVAQSAGHVDINMVDYQVDYLVFAGHKGLSGPIGVGGILMRPHTSLRPFIYGGTGYDSKNPFMPEALPSRLEAGSLNIMGVAGLHPELP